MVKYMEQDEIVGNDAAAAFVGVKAASTWRAYVRRGQAPAPDRREIVGGHALPVWSRATLTKWRDTRPGRGHKRQAAEDRTADTPRDPET